MYYVYYLYMYIYSLDYLVNEHGISRTCIKYKIINLLVKTQNSLINGAV